MFLIILKKQLLFLILFLPIISLGQTREIFVSAPFDKLIIDKTTLKQAKKILGKPTKKILGKPYHIGGGKNLILLYDNTKTIVYFNSKSKILTGFYIDSSSSIKINNLIEVGSADTLQIFKTLGKPHEYCTDNGKPNNSLWCYNRNYEVEFFLNDDGKSFGAMISRHLDIDTNILKTIIDTSKIFFGVFVRHLENGLPNVKVNFVSEKDTITIITNEEGIADTLIPKRPYPKIVIHEKGFDDFEMQITDEFLNEAIFTYDRINLISPTDKIFPQRINLSEPYDQLGIYKTTLKEVEKILGSPNSKKSYDRTEIGKQIQIEYIKAKATFIFNHNSKILRSIVLDSGTSITLNDNIEIGYSDTNIVLNTLGKPDIYRTDSGDDNKSVFLYYYNNYSNYQLMLFFNENGTLVQAVFLGYWQDHLPQQPESSWNWWYLTTYIKIDTNCILKKPISKNGKTFNYFKIHIASDSVAFSGEGNINEYGNVNKNNIAKGQWLYLSDKNAIIVNGKAKNGFKIKKWKTDLCGCSYLKDCFFTYVWTERRTRTYNNKSKFCVE